MKRIQSRLFATILAASLSLASWANASVYGWGERYVEVKGSLLYGINVESPAPDSTKIRIIATSSGDDNYSFSFTAREVSFSNLDALAIGATVSKLSFYFPGPFEVVAGSDTIAGPPQNGFKTARFAKLDIRLAEDYLLTDAIDPRELLESYRAGGFGSGTFDLINRRAFSERFEAALVPLPATSGLLLAALFAMLVGNGRLRYHRFQS